jgi:hypothetical protein
MYAHVSTRQHAPAYTLLSSAPPRLHCCNAHLRKIAALSCQNLHWCTSKASKLSTSTEERRPPHAEGCQNLYWCTSKASKLSTSTEERRPPHARLRTSRAPSKPCPNIWVRAEVQEGLQQLLRCQYLYFCTSNASKVSTKASRVAPQAAPQGVSICTICTFVRAN